MRKKAWTVEARCSALGALALVLGGCGAKAEGGSPAPIYFAHLDAGFSLVDGTDRCSDFGVVNQGDVCESTFEFVSEGPQPLIIRKISQSCGCTSARVFRIEGGERTPVRTGEEIPVGAHFEVRARIETAGKNGDLSSNVSLDTNRAGGLYLLELRGSVRPVLDVSPRADVDFGRITTTERVERELRLESLDRRVFTLTVAGQYERPTSLDIELVPIDPDSLGRSSAWKARLAIGPSFPLGQWKRACTVTADFGPEGTGTAQHTLNLALDAHGVEAVFADPAFLSFGPFQHDEAVERTVTIRAEDGFRFAEDSTVEVVDMDGNPHPLATHFGTATKIESGGRALTATVRIAGLPKSAAGVVAGNLLFMIGHPTVPAPVVRFSGFCRSDEAQSVSAPTESVGHDHSRDDAQPHVRGQHTAAPSTTDGEGVARGTRAIH